VSSTTESIPVPPGAAVGMSTLADSSVTVVLKRRTTDEHETRRDRPDNKRNAT
jgi:hypothetical protein